MGKETLLGVLGAFILSCALFVFAQMFGVFEFADGANAAGIVFLLLAFFILHAMREFGKVCPLHTLLLFLIFILLGFFGFPMEVLTPLAFLAAPFYYYGVEGAGWKECAKKVGLIFERGSGAGFGRGKRRSTDFFANGKIAVIFMQGVVGALGLFAIAFFVSLSLYLLGISDQQNVYEKMLEFPPYLLLLAVTLSPLAEEIFFRGFLRREIGALFSSAIFASLHFFYGSIAEIAAAFFLGWWLCIVYERSRGVYAPVIAHILFNLATVIYVVYFL